MHGKRIQLIYFSMGGSEVKQISLSWPKAIGIFAAFCTVIVLIMAILLGVTTDIFHNWRIVNLAKANSQLNSRLSDMKSKVETIEYEVKKIEKKNDDLRLVVDMEQVNQDIRMFGEGGQSEMTYSTVYSSLNDDAQNEVERIEKLLEGLTKRIQFAHASRDEIQNKHEEDDNRLLHTPSIIPVDDGIIKSKYGMRTDPFTGKRKKHYGIDISAPRKTPVKAPANGKVIEVKNHYTANVGYGKQILIDHGYGIKTRYAHLNSINVRVGQLVARNDTIGTVGDTGRSTGPHLHYEVIRQNNCENPGIYIID
jgi:murein DD-endopeptidase MepM/ murein hydrolase activator NlpD